jgi:hypothetical protein
MNLSIKEGILLLANGDFKSSENYKKVKGKPKDLRKRKSIC